MLKYRFTLQNICKVQKNFKRLPPFLAICKPLPELLMKQKHTSYLPLKRAYQIQRFKWSKHEKTAILILDLSFNNFNALTGSIRTVPGGPGKPSAPGRPGRPAGPFDGKQHKHEYTCTDRNICLCAYRSSIVTHRISTHPLSRISRAAWWTRRTWGSREALFRSKISFYTHAT